MSEFNTNDPFSFFSQLWKGGGNTNPFMPPLSEEEIERKIIECKTVEQWLTMQIGMLQMTTKTLELQKAGLQAFKQGVEPKTDSTP
jgi:hypothetical protein